MIIIEQIGHTPLLGSCGILDCLKRHEPEIMRYAIVIDSSQTKLVIVDWGYKPGLISIRYTDENEAEIIRALIQNHYEINVELIPMKFFNGNWDHKRSKERIP